MYKIAGALAAKGGSLDEVYKVAEWTASNIGTIGVGLEHCHVRLLPTRPQSSTNLAQVPGTATGETHLAADEIEIGLGIHNESGIKRLSPVPPLRELVPQILDFITSTTDKERSYLPFKSDGSDEVVLFLNNLGGLSELEIGGIVNAVNTELATRKIKVARVIAGTFMVCSSFMTININYD